MRFNLGYLVRVTRVDNSAPLYVSELNDYVGKIGTIIAYDPSDNSYRIKLSSGEQQYWFYEDWLELVNYQPNQTNTNQINNSNNNLNNLILLL